MPFTTMFPLLVSSRSVSTPHLFSIPSASYRALMDHAVSQAIIISGESGSGKTEATKKCLQFLSSVAGSATDEISHRILAANPLLEAFGNAKTARNDNSSRFGKLMKTQFTESGSLAGACIVSYLLEKSRIARQSPGERNFHIFFQMCIALPEPARSQLGMRPASAFKYLADSVECPKIDDEKDFHVSGACARTHASTHACALQAVSVCSRSESVHRRGGCFEL